MDANEIINELRDRVAYLEGRERDLLQSVKTLKSACNQIAADGTELVSKFHDDNEQLKVALRNLDTVAAASVGVSGRIKKAAFELGYHGSMEVDELDYLIETARASVMVNQKNVELQAQLVAIQDSVVHGKCANSEPCATFCEAIATRKMFKQLQVERDALAAQNKQFRIIFRSENLSQNETIIALQKMASSVDMLPAQCLAAYDAEVAKQAYLVGFIDGYNQEECLNNPDLEALTKSDEYAAQLCAKAGA